MTLFDSANGQSEHIISVAIPRPLHGLFTYKIPDHMVPLAKVGGWVRVPFGYSVTHAFIVEPPKRISDIPEGTSFGSLKEVIEVNHSDSVIPTDVLNLCRWAHEYYFAPLGEVLNCASSIQTGKKKVKARKKKASVKTKSVSHQLTSDQLLAVQTLDDLRKDKGQVALLQGVTGSGKTEVYIELAKRVLAEGKGVIILVPEIALSPQLHRRFEEGLNIPVALWHSAVSKGKRHEECDALLRGELRVVVGARSAVFAPVTQLGLIIVDEEHDPTYKQEDRVRYHARDLAIVRGKLTQSLIVLGTATPSFETRERVREGKYTKVVLDKRIAPGGLPKIDLVDLCTEEKIENIQAPLAVRTVRTIQEVINAGEQVIVYLNRRGFAAFLLCKDCGEVKGCSQCSVSLTVHKRGGELRCHLCGHKEPIPDACPKCHGSELYPMGAGTESLETELPQLISGAQVSRLDRDQVTSATRLENILDDFREKRTNILLGTQMLVKGHDFPGVTLVVVVLADALFRWPDFRAPERSFQILKQVAGRAGRGEKPGRVMIQTFDPTHPVLQVIEGTFSEEEFLHTERQLRQGLGYPPFGRLARIRFESTSKDEAMNRSKALVKLLQSTMEQELNPVSGQSRSLELLGPSEAFLEKIKGIYRWDLLLKAKSIQVLHKSVAYSREYCAKNKWPFVVDIDPNGI